jgi:hypothetical protein
MLQHILFRQAEVSLAADDQVVVDRQVQGPGGLDQGPGQFLVGGRGSEMAAGVVVDQDKAGGLVFQRQFQDLAGIDHRLVDRAFLNDFLGDDLILAVQKDHPELLVGQAAHGGAAVVHQVSQGLDLLALEGFFLQVALGAGLDQFNEHRGILTETGKLHQGLGGGVQHPVEGAEVLNEPFGQGLDVGVRDGEGQEQFQEFVVRQGPGAALQEALPQAGPVPVVVGFLGFRGHLYFLLLRQLPKCNCENR